MYDESHPILRFQTVLLRKRPSAGLTVTRGFAAHSGPARSRFPQASDLIQLTTASMNEEDQKRIETVSQFLLQSPPGEINDVLNGTVDCVFDARITLSLIPPASA